MGETKGLIRNYERGSPGARYFMQSMQSTRVICIDWANTIHSRQMNITRKCLSRLRSLFANDLAAIDDEIMLAATIVLKLLKRIDGVRTLDKRVFQADLSLSVCLRLGPSVPPRWHRSFCLNSGCSHDHARPPPVDMLFCRSSYEELRHIRSAASGAVRLAPASPRLSVARVHG